MKRCAINSFIVKAVQIRDVTRNCQDVLFCFAKLLHEMTAYASFFSLGIQENVDNHKILVSLTALHLHDVQAVVRGDDPVDGLGQGLGVHLELNAELHL